ncbi:MAG: hypothetical protein ACOVSR_04805, partial [Bacteroidia bacterium]
GLSFALCCLKTLYSESFRNCTSVGGFTFALAGSKFYIILHKAAFTAFFMVCFMKKKLMMGKPKAKLPSLLNNSKLSPNPQYSFS